MDLREKYKASKTKTVIEDEKTKVVISDEAYAVCEFIELLIKKLEHIRLSK